MPHFLLKATPGTPFQALRRSCALFWLGLIGIGGFVGCDRDESVGEPRADYTLDLVEVIGGPVEMGFSRGTLRWKEQVPGFRIARIPVSVGEYTRCVAAGACEAASVSEACWPTEVFGESGAPRADSAPELCASLSQAVRFCRWHGTRLPKPGEWMLAARGASVQRFPWGNVSASGEQHMLSGGDGDAMSPMSPRLGLHPAGRSDFEVEDVLPLGAELLGPDPESRLLGCRRDGCAVAGTEPGAIDRWGSSREPLASFRCLQEIDQ